MASPPNRSCRKRNCIAKCPFSFQQKIGKWKMVWLFPSCHDQEQESTDVAVANADRFVLRASGNDRICGCMGEMDISRRRWFIHRLLLRHRNGGDGYPISHIQFILRLSFYTTNIIQLQCIADPFVSAYENENEEPEIIDRLFYLRQSAPCININRMTIIIILLIVL